MTLKGWLYRQVNTVTFVWTFTGHNNNRSVTFYSGTAWVTGTKILRNINPQIPHKHSQPSLPGLPVYLQGLVLRITVGHSWGQKVATVFWKWILQFLLQIGISGPWCKGMIWSTFAARSQRSRSHDTEIRFGDMANVPFLILFSWVHFLVVTYLHNAIQGLLLTVTVTTVTCSAPPTIRPMSHSRVHTVFPV